MLVSDSGLYLYKLFLQTCEKCFHSNRNEIKILTQNGTTVPCQSPNSELDTDMQITLAST